MAKNKQKTTKDNVLGILISYNELFSCLFTNAIFTEESNNTLKLIRAKFEEISALISALDRQNSEEPK